MGSKNACALEFAWNFRCNIKCSVIIIIINNKTIKAILKLTLYYFVNVNVQWNILQTCLTMQYKYVRYLNLEYFYVREI